MRRVSFLFFLPFILLSALLTRGGGKQAHSSPCLIHRAATVNVQRGGKDNFSQGRLPGTTLDHRIPSSPFSPFMNKNAVYQRKRFFFFLSVAAQKGTLTFNSKGNDGLSTCALKWINTACDNSIIQASVVTFCSCRPIDNLTA